MKLGSNKGNLAGVKPAAMPSPLNPIGSQYSMMGSNSQPAYMKPMAPNHPAARYASAGSVKPFGNLEEMANQAIKNQSAEARTDKMVADSKAAEAANKSTWGDKLQGAGSALSGAAAIANVGIGIEALNESKRARKDAAKQQAIENQRYDQALAKQEKFLNEVNASADDYKLTREPLPMERI